MKKKNIPQPDGANRNQDAGKSVEEEFVEFLDDEELYEMEEIISLESIEERFPEEVKNSLRFPQEYDPDMELKGLKEREWEKKMGVNQ